MIDKINGKTPEEIKKGLECCISPGLDVCDECPYQGEPCKELENLKDFLAYIQRLERERDAAVEELRGICRHCAHYVPSNSFINCDKTESCIHVNFGMSGAVDEWQWRGVREVE